MRTLIVAPVLAAALFFAGFGLAGGSSTVKLTARLDATQETPAPKAATRADGAFSATLSGRRLTWRLTFVRLTGRAVAAHVHLGRLRVAGPVAVPLCGPCASGAHGTVTVTPRLRWALLAGNAYVNVHTARNPAGEIRGQIEGPHGVMPAPRTTTTTPTTTGGGYGY
ncbi:MAG TPA: CHRD domain-containing protein [Gaiellaceae bacterium]|nr:CHRD domain-containing protein [Gaiellaceae bacterium]